MGPDAGLNGSSPNAIDEFKSYFFSDSKNWQQKLIGTCDTQRGSLGIICNMTDIVPALQTAATRTFV